MVRYGPNKNKYYSHEKFADILDEILRTIISRGKGIELNMAGFKYGLGHAHPVMDTLKRYKELGGEIITIGSDGHTPEQIAWEFEKAPEILKEAGFELAFIGGGRKATKTTDKWHIPRFQIVKTTPLERFIQIVN